MMISAHLTSDLHEDRGWVTKKEMTEQRKRFDIFYCSEKGELREICTLFISKGAAYIRWVVCYVSQRWRTRIGYIHNPEPLRGCQYHHQH